ncbi:MAG TPA: hypothetical protein VFR72_07310, partial [Gemmatimonadales bacterium]|nr:hypothetical protein [Gemmatimonadales bacterium]
LRAAAGLARTWSERGKPCEARDLLASVYGGFTEGSDTPDLKEAGALLDQLTSAPPGSRARPRRRSAALVNNPGVRRETGRR